MFAQTKDEELFFAGNHSPTTKPGERTLALTDCRGVGVFGNAFPRAKNILVAAEVAAERGNIAGAGGLAASAEVVEVDGGRAARVTLRDGTAIAVWREGAGTAPVAAFGLSTKGVLAWVLVDGAGAIRGSYAPAGSGTAWNGKAIP